MPLEGHWQRQHATRASDSRRERRVTLLVAGALAACALAAGVAVVTTGSGARTPGCIDVTFASTTGGAVMHACGAAAVRICRGETPLAARITSEVRRRCREVGAPVPVSTR